MSTLLEAARIYDQEFGPAYATECVREALGLDLSGWVEDDRGSYDGLCYKTDLDSGDGTIRFYESDMITYQPPSKGLTILIGPQEQVISSFSEIGKSVREHAQGYRQTRGWSGKAFSAAFIFSIVFTLLFLFIPRTPGAWFLLVPAATAFIMGVLYLTLFHESRSNLKLLLERQTT